MHSGFVVILTFLGFLGFSIFTIFPSMVSAQGRDWPQLILALEQNNLASPVHITNAGDNSDRLFVVEQVGTIRILRDNVLLNPPFLSIGGIGGRVGCCGERGLLSIAFPPNYAITQHFYVYYTNLNGALVIARYKATADPDVADPNSEVILLTIPHPTYSNHNGGQLAFSPRDAYLYIGVGDGGSGGDPDNHAQDLSTLLGKILRIDVESDPGTAHYLIPDANPYKNDPKALPEIWASGVRNPWKFSFDRQTGDLYIGDVGQNAYEEIDFQRASSPGGKNYGWRCREGFHAYERHSKECAGRLLTKPVTEYSHKTDCSITGGFVYRGVRYSQLQGIYFYGDFCSGKIRGLRHTNTAWESKMLLDSSLNISSFGESEEGEIYVADLGGALYRITAPPPLNVDLTGSWDTLSSTCHITLASPRCTVQGRFLLRNQGALSSPRRALIKFYLSQDETLSSDDRELRQQQTGKLIAGMTVALSFRKNLPFGDTALKQFVIAVVDAEHAIAETDENNNIVVSGLI